MRVPKGAPELPADEIVSALAAASVGGLLDDEDTDIASTKLREAANASSDEATKQGLHLLADVASMMLHGDQWDAPYGPWFSMGNQRGMIPSDLSDRDLEVLRWVAQEVEIAELSARAGDLVWLQSRDRRSDLDFALLAVEKWAAQPVSDEHWARTGRENLVRAIELAKRMKLSDHHLLQIQANAIDAGSTTDKAWFAAHIGYFLIEQGLAGSRADDVLGLLDRALSDLAPELNASEVLLTGKARLLKGLNRDEEAASAEEGQVELLFAEAVRRSSDSHIVEAHFLENAYQRARCIPRKWRSERVTALIAELPTRIREAGAAGFDEMSLIETGGDITDEVRIVRESVRNKDLPDALAALVRLASFSEFDKSREDAETFLEGSIMGLVGGSTFASDGRKVDSTEVDNYYGLPSVVWRWMLLNYERRVSLVAVGIVIPAMEVISAEHRITQGTIQYLVGEASIIPPHVEQLFALGLYHGTRHEWAAALHLLAPQIEAIVRYHLREAGVDTERIDAENSISTETGISTLMKFPVADELFGRDLAWEIRALLCGPTGPNLRNLVAHGLVGAGVANGPHATYLWWFAMRLVFIPYYNRLRSDKTATAAEQAEATEAESEPRVPPDSDGSAEGDATD